MADITTYPLADKQSTTLTQELSTTGLTIYVADSGDFTFPASVTTYGVIDPGKSTMEIVKLESKTATTYVIASGGRNQSQGNGVTTTAQTHAVGSKIIISDNYAFWAAIVTAINAKLDDTGAAMSGSLTFTGTTNPGLVVNSLTTAQRTALTPTNGTIVYDSSLTVLYQYIAGAWQVVATGTLAPIDINGQTEKTVPVANDEFVIYDSAASANKKLKISKLLNGASSINSLTELTDALAAGDEFVVYDTSGTVNKKVTYANLQSLIQSDIEYFGSGTDGDVTISSNTSLSADMYYKNLTVNNGFTLNPNGYKIYVAGTLTNNGTIARVGSAGGNGGNASSGVGGTAGAAGAALATGTIYGGLAGKIGAAGVTGTNNGNNGTTGASLNPSITGVNGVAGGTGGDVTARTGGTAGAAGSATGEDASFTPTYTTATTLTLNTEDTITLLRQSVTGATSTTTLSTSAGSGSGSSGASNIQVGSPASGGGGGSGGNGGIVYIAAKTLTNNSVISVAGGAGGNAGTGFDQDTGGSGGGAGGQGGLIILIYRTLTAGTLTVSGGAIGSKSNGTGGSGTNGTDGTVGNAGKYIKVKIS